MSIDVLVNGGGAGVEFDLQASNTVHLRDR